MVTFAQAQERAERWVNEDVSGPFQREVRVREFDLGFVAWAEDRAGGPTTEGGRARLVIARDSGETTLWPGLPVGEVIRRYEEEYGAVADAAVVEAPPQRIDLEATSFLLTPPEWLQEAADRRTSGAGLVLPVDGPAAPEPVRDAVPVAGAGGGAGARSAGAGAPPVPADAPSVPDQAASVSVPDQAASVPVPGQAVSVRDEPAVVTPWAGTDVRADEDTDDRSVGLPATVFAPPLAGFDDEDTPPAGAGAEARTELIAGGSQLPRTMMAPAVEEAGAGGPVAPPMPSSPPPGPPAGAVPYGGPVPPADTDAAGPDGTGPDAAGLAELPPPSGPPIADVPPPPAYAGSGAAEGPGAPPAPPGAGVHAAAMTPADGSALPGNAGGPPPPGVPGAGGADRTGPGAPDGGADGSAPSAAAPAGGYVPTQLVSQLDADQVDLSAVDGPEAAGPEGEQGPPAPPSAGAGAGAGAGGGVHAAATMLAGGAALPAGAAGPGGPGGAGGPAGPGVPPPPAPPGVPPGPPGGPKASGAPGTSGTSGASGDQAASGAAGGPPPPPSAPPSAVPGGSAGAGGGVHAAATMLADGAGGPGGPGMPPPGVPGPPAPAPAAPHPVASAPAAPPPGMPPSAAPQSAAPPASGSYGYPQAPPSGQPTVGPGYMAVLSYRAPDGSEQKIVRRSAPGTPHPEWQLLHELRGMNVPPQQVLELHTELESCDVPGGYCARMVRETWPQVRISHTAAYGTEHASRQQGVRHLVEHQGELHQVADGPARPAPVRAPLPHPSQVQVVPPVPPQVFGQELEQSFGPQGIFRFDQRAVSRHGVPEVVAQTLVWAGLPVDFGPFFWAQAQPGRPVPTLAELAAERGVRPAADAGSYLVMGNDFGRQLCVQYGTAHIVAVPLDGGAQGPGGQPAVPQFVNSGLPEFVRCLAMLGRMWRLRYGLTPEQAGRWTVDFQAQLVALDAPALGSPETWWSVLLEQMWDGLL
ncbi:SUKH-4 family immunity protein [Streptomyces sp. NPDC045369]|uniref:SUKH-4 family immunity protein n=1 Tax=Streptomyces sp. NPDC045369 TaxID=3155732 RepID=UPI0033CCF773